MDTELALRSLPELLQGALVTILLVLGSALSGIALAMPIAVARQVPNFIPNAVAFGYCLFFRGTPALVQIFLIYYGLGQFQLVRDSPIWVILREAHWCALISLTLLTSAYTAEILHGAISNVDRGVVEAAKSLGLRSWPIYRLIIIPLAIRLALPAYGNELIMLLKGSALVSTITVMDLTGAATSIYYRTYDPFTPLLSAGAIYLSMSLVIGKSVSLMERRLSVHGPPLKSTYGLDHESSW
jgi:His/Glu/Gln/Arg/opine family amino acid ABC transporter permease subunit